MSALDAQIVEILTDSLLSGLGVRGVRAGVVDPEQLNRQHQLESVRPFVVRTYAFLVKLVVR